MTTNPMVLEKQRNMRAFADILNKNPSTPLKKLAAAFSVKTGLRTEKLNKYYRDMVDAGLVKERDFEGVVPE